MDSKLNWEISDTVIAANQRIKDVDGGARETPLDHLDLKSIGETDEISK